MRAAARALGEEPRSADATAEASSAGSCAGTDERVHLGAVARGARAGERGPADAAPRHRRLPGARPARRRTTRSGSGRPRSRTWGSSSRGRGSGSSTPRAAPNGRPGSWAGSSTSPGTASTAGRSEGQRGPTRSRLAGGGRDALGAELRRALARGDSACRGPARPRRRRRRRRRDLSPHVARRSRSPRTPARTSAPSRCRSSPGSRRPR